MRDLIMNILLITLGAAVACVLGLIVAAMSTALSGGLIPLWLFLLLLSLTFAAVGAGAGAIWLHLARKNTNVESIHVNDIPIDVPGIPL